MRVQCQLHAAAPAGLPSPLQPPRLLPCTRASQPIKPSSQHGKQDRSASQGRRSLAGLEGAAWRASLDASVRNGAAYLLRPTDAGSVHDGSKHGGSARSMRHSAGGAMEATQPKPALAGRSSLSDPQCNVTFEKAYTAAARSEALERAMMASLAAEAPGRMMHSEPCNISNWAVAGKGGPSAMCSGGHAHRGEGEGEGAADLDAAPHELDTGSSLSSMFCRGASNELLPVAQAPAQQAEGSAAAAAAAPAAALGAQAQAGVRQCPPPPWPLHVITLETLEQRRQPSPAPGAVAAAERSVCLGACWGHRERLPGCARGRAGCTAPCPSPPRTQQRALQCSLAACLRRPPPGTPPSASSNSASPRLHVAMPSPLRQGQGQGQGVPRAQSLQLIKHMAATAPNSSGRLSVESGRPCSDVQLELEAVRMALEVRGGGGAVAAWGSAHLCGWKQHVSIAVVLMTGAPPPHDAVRSPHAAARPAGV